MEKIVSKLLDGHNARDSSTIYTFLILLCCCTFLFLEVHFINITWDDSYIFYRYAANFVSGHGLVFNPGEYIEGYTSFLWVLLLSLFGKTGVDIPLLGKLLCILFGFGSVLMTYLICREFDKSLFFFPLVAVLLLTFRIDFGVHFQSGMETSLYTFTLSFAFYLYQRRHQNTYALLTAGAVASLLPLIHPEGILFGVGIVLAEFINTGYRNLKSCVKTMSVFFLPVVCVLLLHLLWRHSYYGDWLPNTYYAKANEPQLILYIRGAYHLMKFFIYGGGLVYYIPVLFFIKCTIRQHDARSLLAVVLLYLLFNIYSSGDWFPYSRLMMPVLPLVILAVAYGLVKTLSLLNANNLVRATVIAVFLLAGYQTGIRSTMEPSIEVFSHRDQVNQWIKLGQHFKTMKEDFPNLSIASYPVGAIGYYSGARIIDMLGLTDRHIAKKGIKLRGYVGHERSDMRYVLEQQPDIIYFGTSETLIDGSIVPEIYEFESDEKSECRYTREEIYHRLWQEYRHVTVADTGNYWVRKGMK